MSDEMQQFFATFDAYALARDEVRRDISGDAAHLRHLVDFALIHWHSLLDMRLAMKEREPFECICNQCGLRHGTPHEKAQF
jgi:hypothetical protein